MTHQDWLAVCSLVTIDYSTTDYWANLPFSFWVQPKRIDESYIYMFSDSLYMYNF